MPVPRAFEAKYQRFLAGVASAERLPTEALDAQFRGLPGAVVVFLLTHWEKEGHAGFTGAHRLIDLLGNLDCRVDALSWLVDGAHLGIRGRRGDGTPFDLLLPSGALGLDRAELVRVLKRRLTLLGTTRVVAGVNPGHAAVKGKTVKRTSGRTKARPPPTDLQAP